jgi:hypothetical protein
MSKPTDNHVAPVPKTVFTRLTPDMSIEQKFENLKAALIKSGFFIKENDKPRVDRHD